MPSIQLDKILENISHEKALYKNVEKTRKEEDEAWKRVATNNNITLHEAKAIYNVLIRKYNTEKSKGNSTWKMYDIMHNIQEGSFEHEDPEKEKEENEGMIELMEVFEEEDSASEVNDSELDKSNGSSGSKTSGISTRSSTGSVSQGRSPEAPKKLLNTDMIPITPVVNTPISQKSQSQVFIPPNLQKVNLRPVGGGKKDVQAKRKAESAPGMTNMMKKQAVLPTRPKPTLPAPQQTKSPNQAQSHQISASSEVGKREPLPEVANIKVESTTPIKTEPILNGYMENPAEDSNNVDAELKMPSNFFKHLCSSNRHEAFGLYLANFLNRLDKSSARKLELKLLQTVTEFQAEQEN